MTEVSTPLWERQPWDSDASFARFHAYYLAQPAPRSALEAYRRYSLAEKGREWGGDRLPGNWERWAQGKDRDGNPLPGAMTWAARAAAWDAHQAENDRAEWERRREDHNRRIWELSETIHSRLAEMFGALPEKWSISDAARLLATMDKAVRLSLGVPTEQASNALSFDGSLSTVTVDVSALSVDQLEAIVRAGSMDDAELEASIEEMARLTSRTGIPARPEF